MLVYLNGEFLPLEQARISPLDRGFLFGDGVYEMVPFYHGIPFLFEEHITRLGRSLQALDIKNPLTKDQWKAIVHTLSEQASLPTHNIYLQITRGAGLSRQHQYEDGLEPTVFAMVTNMRLLSDAEKQTGLRAVTVPDERWQNCYIKSLNLLPNILAIQQAYVQQAYEAIQIHQGYVTEGASSNVFIVKQNILFTPPKTAEILWGITRDFVLSLARKHHIAFEERALNEDELYDADEIWITSSGREVVPITRLNDHRVGDGEVGPIWKKINASYENARNAC